MNKFISISIISSIILCCPFLPIAFANNTLTGSTAQTDNDDNQDWEYTQSIKYSKGKYGTSQESETYEEDSILQRDFANADLYVTIPSLWQTGNVTATEEGKEIIKRKTIKTFTNTTITPTITGLGDIALNSDYYPLEEGRNAPLDVTLTSYLKVPTASSSKGLGTGEMDGGPGIGLAKRLIYNFKVIADAAYTFDGKISGNDTRNQTSLDGGLEYDITPQTTAIIKYEYSNATGKASPQAEDIYLSLAYKINGDWKISGATAFGLTNGSPAQSYLLGATMSFSGGILGILPPLDMGPQKQIVHRTAASPFDPIDTRIISDPLFLPLKGQLFCSTAYTYNLTKENTFNYLGEKTSKSYTDMNKFSQTDEYGISDRLTIRLLSEYEFSKAFQALSTTGAITTSHNEGFTNPTISTIYRILDQSSSPADLDFTLSIAPNAFKSKEGSSSDDGTEASGYQPLSLITGVGREMKNFTIQGTFTTTYVGNRYYEVLSDNENYLDQEYFSYTWAINTQVRITDRFSINLGTGYTLWDNEYDTNLSTGTKSLNTPANVLDYTASLNYHFIPNRLVGGLTYTYNDYTNSKITYPTITSNIETRHHYANVFGIRIQYLF